MYDEIVYDGYRGLLAPHDEMRGRVRPKLAPYVFGVLSAASGLLSKDTPVWAAPTQESASPQIELLSGVRAFRAERYAEALGIFERLSEGGKIPEIGLYLGMTHHKLGNHVEALAAFRSARGAGLREPVAEYYEAVSCYRLGLLQRARQSFVLITELRPFGTGGAGETQPPPLGPRLRQGAQRFIESIDAATASVSPIARLDAVLARAEGLLGEGTKTKEAVEWLDEASQLLSQVEAQSRGTKGTGVDLVRKAHLQRLLLRAGPAAARLHLPPSPPPSSAGATGLKRKVP